MLRATAYGIGTLASFWMFERIAQFAGATVVPVLAGLLAAGLVAGLLPAWRCYHRSLSDGLSPDVGG